MAIEQINIGVEANDGSGDTARAAGDKINANFTELSNQLELLALTTVSGSMRTGSGQVGSGNNPIAYSSEFVNNCLILLFPDGDDPGLSVVSQDENGFVVNALVSGSFNYIAIIRI